MSVVSVYLGRFPLKLVVGSIIAALGSLATL